jgi:membrane dipeptidase
MPSFIVDAHNDLLEEVAFRRSEANPFAAHWLENLRAGSVGLQVCAVSVDIEDMPEAALRRALERIGACRRAAGDNRDDVVLVLTADDLGLVESGARLGLMLALEGAEPLGYDAEMADIFWDLGVRMFSLTWNRRNPFADGLAEPSGAGLSARGCALVDRLVTHGAILDLAHASERTFFGILERSGDSEVVVSHAGCRAVFDTPRNLSDEQLEALASRGGVLGLMALPLTVDPRNPSIERLIDHVDHAVEMMGIDHVGLGGDFLHQITRSGAVRLLPDGTAADALMPPGMLLGASLENLQGPEDYPALVAALKGRGYTGDRLAAVLSDNFLRLFRRALPGPQ